MKTCPKGHGDYDDNLALCPVCKKEYRKAYYEKNKDRERATTLKWIANNREAYLAGKKARRTPEDGRKYYANRLAKRPYDSIWRTMIDRCYHPKFHKYPSYGARGIKVCDRWLGPNGYANFEADMGPRPSPLHTIDRRNNDGDYEPSNVGWADKKQQQRNRRVNSNITINGKTQCVSAWAEELGLKRTTLQRRLDLGWEGNDLARPADQKYNRLAKSGSGHHITAA